MLFGFGDAVARLVEGSESQLGVHGLGPDFGSFFEIGFSLIRQVGAYLEHSHAQERIGPGRVRVNGFLHLLHGCGQFVFCEIIVRPGRIGFRTVRLLFAQQVEVDLRLFQRRRLAGGDQQIGQVGLRRIDVWVEFDSAGEFPKGVVQVLQLK